MNRIHPISVSGHSKPRAVDYTYFNNSRTMVITSYYSTGGKSSKGPFHSGLGDHIESDNSNSDHDEPATFQHVIKGSNSSIKSYVDKFTSSHQQPESLPSLHLETARASDNCVGKTSKVAIVKSEKHASKRKRKIKRRKKNKVCVSKDAVLSGQGKSGKVKSEVVGKKAKLQSVNKINLIECKNYSDSDSSGDSERIVKPRVKKVFARTGKNVCRINHDSDSSDDIEWVVKPAYRKPTMAKKRVTDVKIQCQSDDGDYDSSDSTEWVIKPGFKQTTLKEIVADGSVECKKHENSDGNLIASVQKLPVEELPGTEVYHEQGDDSVWIIRPAYTKHNVNIDNPNTKEINMDIASIVTDNDDKSDGDAPSRSHKIPNTEIYCEEGDDSVWIIRPTFTKTLQGEHVNQEVNIINSDASTNENGEKLSRDNDVQLKDKNDSVNEVFHREPLMVQQVSQVIDKSETKKPSFWKSFCTKAARMFKMCRRSNKVQDIM